VVPLFYTFSAHATFKPASLQEGDIWSVPEGLRQTERRDLIARLDHFGVLKVPMSFKRIREYFK